MVKRSRTMRMVAAAVAAASLALPGCAEDDRDLGALLTADIDEDGCAALLSGDGMEQLVGDRSAHRLTEIGSLQACQALISGDVGSRVSVIRVRGSVWAESQRATFGDLLVPEARDPAIVALIEQAATGTVSDDDACRLFRALAEATFGSPDSLVVTTFPLGGLDVASAQACVDGDFGLINVEASGDIELADELRDQLTVALDELLPADLGE